MKRTKRRKYRQYFSFLHLALLGVSLLTAALALGLLGQPQLEYSFVRQAVSKVSPALPAPSGAQYSLIVDKLALKVPIILNVSGTDETIYLKAVEAGVAHYANTALPGEIGNSVIFGHSTFFLLAPGQYKTVFLKLRRLKPGDQFQIKRDSATFDYRVFRSEIVEPTDLAILKQGTDEQVTLITCWPPGTVAKRYIVQANRIR